LFRHAIRLTIFNETRNSPGIYWQYIQRKLTAI
jgi:hypothetical protein